MYACIYTIYTMFAIRELILLMKFQVRERLRVALERNTSLEEELAHTKDEVSSIFKLNKNIKTFKMFP